MVSVTSRLKQASLFLCFRTPSFLSFTQDSNSQYHFLLQIIPISVSKSVISDNSVHCIFSLECEDVNTSSCLTIIYHVLLEASFCFTRCLLSRNICFWGYSFTRRWRYVQGKIGSVILEFSCFILSRLFPNNHSYGDEALQFNYISLFWKIINLVTYIFKFLQLKLCVTWQRQ